MGANVCAVYGIPQVSVYHFSKLMREQGITFLLFDKGKQPQFVKNGTKVSPYPVLITSVEAYLRFHDQFNGLVTVFLNDTIALLEKVPSCILVGCVKQKIGWEYTPLAGDELRMLIDSVPVTERASEPTQDIESVLLSQVIEKFNTASILAPLQTLFYRVRDKEVRTKLQDVVFRYLAGERGPKQLVSDLAGVNIPTSLKDRFDLECKRPEALLLRQACEETRKGTSVEDAANALKVSDFDVRYVMHRCSAKP